MFATPAFAQAAGGAGAGSAFASSHREAFAVLNEPCADNTDTYAWVSDGSIRSAKPWAVRPASRTTAAAPKRSQKSRKSIAGTSSVSPRVRVTSAPAGVIQVWPVLSPGA